MADGYVLFEFFEDHLERDPLVLEGDDELVDLDD
tara:strand:- start:773 stop:874 length:102 start_codon:yes stop_codon:yes gene_type:complete